VRHHTTNSDFLETQFTYKMKPINGNDLRLKMITKLCSSKCNIYLPAGFLDHSV